MLNLVLTSQKTSKVRQISSRKPDRGVDKHTGSTNPAWASIKPKNKTSKRIVCRLVFHKPGRAACATGRDADYINTGRAARQTLYVIIAHGQRLPPVQRNPSSSYWPQSSFSGPGCRKSAERLPR